MSSTRLPSPKALIGSSPQILQIPKAQQTVQCVSPKALQALASPQGSGPGAKPTIQIKQESGEHVHTLTGSLTSSDRTDRLADIITAQLLHSAVFTVFVTRWL